jgi:hypothetical protein
MFFSEKDDVLGRYRIVHGGTEMECRMLHDYPEWRSMALKLYPDFNEADRVAAELEIYLRLFRSVRIIPVNKGQDWQGIDKYSVQRVLDDEFWMTNGEFVKVDKSNPLVRHYNSVEEAEAAADAAGYTITRRQGQLDFVKEFLPRMRRVAVHISGVQKIGYLISILEEIRKDFPDVLPDLLEIRYYPGLKCFGVEFMVPKSVEILQEYEEVSRFEPSNLIEESFK